ncbi:MAG: TIM barrel protein [Candidatus Diapherotrites archaeon]|nr:TIM barrel protein [Candidatus Diapherotrites archaeon]
MPAKMLFGTAGVPHSSKAPDSVSGIARVRELGLDAMELEFVRGVHMSPAAARQVNAARESSGVLLRVHAPYFINLNSADKKKLAASRKRIMDSAEIGELCGAQIVTFHLAYFQGQQKEEVLERVSGVIAELAEEIEKSGWKIRLAPETTGKPSQLGSLQETLEMCEKVKGLLPMVDWSHLHARQNGRFKSKADFVRAIEEMPEKFIHNLHMHASGINFTEKGERNHMNMEEKGNTFNFRWLLEALHEKKAGGCIICESPNLEEDALLMQKYWEKLG